MELVHVFHLLYVICSIFTLKMVHCLDGKDNPVYIAVLSAFEMERMGECKGEPTKIEKYFYKSLPSLAVCLSHVSRYCVQQCFLQNVGIIKNYRLNKKVFKEHLTMFPKEVRRQLYYAVLSCYPEPLDPIDGECNKYKLVLLCAKQRYKEICEINY